MSCFLFGVKPLPCLLRNLHYRSQRVHFHGNQVFESSSSATTQLHKLPARQETVLIQARFLSKITLAPWRNANSFFEHWARNGVQNLVEFAFYQCQPCFTAFLSCLPMNDCGSEKADYLNEIQFVA